MGISKTGLEAESYTFYAVGVCLILTRTVSRILTLGSPLKLQCDDWVVLFVLFPFTATVFCANGVFIQKEGQTLSLSQLKMRFALEELHITTNWLVKACLLILYRRIFPASTSKKERRYFTYTAACCLVSFLLVQGLLPIWCYPMNRYWINDAANTSCTSYHNHAIATLALESFTTVLVLIIPIPFIPTPRIYLLFTLLFLGLATLVTEILGRYRIISNPSSPAYLHWYMAETVTLISYANLPFLNSLFNAANNARFRHLSNASLSSWPRSYKDTPPPRAQRQRLNCMATIIDSPSPPRVQKMESTVSNMARLDAEDAWDDGSTTVSVPPMSVRKVSLNDPPPELEVYWSPRRHSTRDMDLEIARVDVKSSFR